jgi:hypothetical protein
MKSRGKKKRWKEGLNSVFIHAPYKADIRIFTAYKYAHPTKLITEINRGVFLVIKCCFTAVGCVFILSRKTFIKKKNSVGNMVDNLQIKNGIQFP